MENEQINNQDNTQSNEQEAEQSDTENSQLGEQEEQLISTEIDNPYEKLNEKHRTAVDMAIAYFPYQTIAEYCKVEYATVRTWFSKDGILYHAYQCQSAIVREERKELFSKIREVFEFAAIDAATTLATAAKVPNREGINASDSILDRVGFKPTDKIQHGNDPDNPIEMGKVVVYLPDNGRTKPTE